jgi:hypothetical protein
VLAPNLSFSEICWSQVQYVLTVHIGALFANTAGHSVCISYQNNSLVCFESGKQAFDLGRSFWRGFICSKGPLCWAFTIFCRTCLSPSHCYSPPANPSRSPLLVTPVAQSLFCVHSFPESRRSPSFFGLVLHSLAFKFKHSLIKILGVEIASSNNISGCLVLVPEGFLHR